MSTATRVSSDAPPTRSRRTTAVFPAALAVVVPIVLWGALSPGGLASSVDATRTALVDTLGWVYLLTATALLVGVVVLASSRYGKVRLGRDDERPEFSTGAWFAMLFSAGMGIGLVFWGVAEPVAHFTSPPTGEGGTDLAARDALRSTFFHWGLHPWAIYSALALGLAYARFRRGAPGTISGALRPLLGRRADGPVGTAVDVVAVVATVFGVATSLGLGAAQINGGLEAVTSGGVPISAFVQVAIIAVVTALFLLSALSGLQRGIKWLSSANVVLAAALLLLVMVAGPTSRLLGAFTTTLGGYVTDLPAMSLDAAPFDAQRQEWVNGWTIFYWAWWISWSPFVATFIARISRGRTIREFVLGVLAVPTLLSALWFSVFGTAGILAQRGGLPLADEATETQLFALLDTLPLGTLAALVAMTVITTFFITSADSATYVLGSLSSGGADPRRAVTVVWGLLISACAAVLLVAGGLEAVQTASIIAAFPFLFVLVAAAVSLALALRDEPLGSRATGSATTGSTPEPAAPATAAAPAAATAAAPTATDPYPTVDVLRERTPTG